MSDPNFEKGWEVPGHDYQAYTGATADHGPTQVIYKKGGSGGKTLATETITYNGANKIATRAIVWANDIYM